MNAHPGAQVSFTAAKLYPKADKVLAFGRTYIQVRKLTRIKNVKGCWYYKVIKECPACGAFVIWKYRKDPPKLTGTDAFEHEYRHCGCVKMGRIP